MTWSGLGDSILRSELEKAYMDWACPKGSIICSTVTTSSCAI